MKMKSMQFGEVVGDKGLFVDGDWVESKDQDANGEVRLIQLADIGAGEFLNKSNRRLTMEKAQKLRCTFLEKGDLLVARMPDPIGRTCIFPGDYGPCATVVDVCVVRPDPEIVYVPWLNRILNTSVFQHEFSKFITGTTRQRISRRNLESTPLVVPPLPEQKRIADILDKADAIRRKRAQALELTDQFLQSVFLDMFGDPVTNPKGWDFEVFGNVCDTRLGKMLDGKRQTGRNSRPYLRNANVQWRRFDLNSVLEMDFDEKDRDEFRLKNGDVLICEGGEVGRTAIWRDELPECYFQKALHRARPKSEVCTSEYIAFLLECLASRGALIGQTSSATIAHLTGVKLKGLEIPLPPYSLQQAFSVLCERHDQLKDHVHNAESKASVLFQSLAQRAFRGEL